MATVAVYCCNCTAFRCRNSGHFLPRRIWHSVYTVFNPPATSIAFTRHLPTRNIICRITNDDCHYMTIEYASANHCVVELSLRCPNTLICLFVCLFVCLLNRFNSTMCSGIYFELYMFAAISYDIKVPEWLDLAEKQHLY